MRVGAKREKRKKNAHNDEKENNGGVVRCKSAGIETRTALHALCKFISPRLQCPWILEKSSEASFVILIV